MAERQRRDTETVKLTVALAALQKDERLAADELVAARSTLQEVLEQQQLEEPAAEAAPCVDEQQGGCRCTPA